MSTIRQPPPTPQASHVRYHIAGLLFFVTIINYGNRAALSIAGPPMSASLGFDAVDMGYIFSAFSWAYVLCQLPGGCLLDRFGSRPVYLCSIFFWSIFTLLQAAVGFLTGQWAFILLFGLCFMVGMASSPSFPGNSRIAAAWFPVQERATALAFVNSSQYFATVLFVPLMASLTLACGWPLVFVCMGTAGLLAAWLWYKNMHSPLMHPRVTALELHYMEAGGALTYLDCPDAGHKAPSPSIQHIRRLLTSRMMLGIYMGQYCINALSFFFVTWFPVYLIQGRGMSLMNAGFIAAIPALCGVMGCLLGGVVSDRLMRKTGSLTFARKAPVIVGMMLAGTLLLCNYVESTTWMVFFMSVAFFGKGFGALGWAVLADTSPPEITGLCGGLFNTFSNMSGIVTPIVIGYIVQSTGSFAHALSFVGLHAVVAILSFTLIVGDIERIKLVKAAAPQQAA